jgi:ankyrin repeat protein
LLFAAENGIIEEVKSLLDKNGPLGDLVADVNARGLDQWTALHFAANEGKADIVQILISQDDIDIDSQSTIGRTPCI